MYEAAIYNFRPLHDILFPLFILLNIMILEKYWFSKIALKYQEYKCEFKSGLILEKLSLWLKSTNKCAKSLS